MKKTLTHLISYSFTLLIIVAFGNSSINTSTKVESEKSPEEKQKVNSSNNCLEPFHGKPENLLTKEMVAKYVDFQGAEVESKTLAEALNKTELPKSYIDIASIQFKWKIDRQKSSVSLQSINKIELYKSKTSVERFYAKYHTPTPEEQAEKKEAYDSLVLNNEELKQKTNEANAEMLSEAIGFNFEYLNIEGIGDAAVWEIKVNGLIVLVGDYQFTVTVDLNKGNELDLEKAKLIAKAIIAKACS